MQIDIKQLTNAELVNELGGSTSHKKMNWPIVKWLASEHSPIRGLVFRVKFHAIYKCASDHLARHKHGVEHFIETHRPDSLAKYGRTDEALDRGRFTRRDHTMIINAQALINMSKKRLCSAAEIYTIKAMKALKSEISKVNPEMASMMVPECIYRAGICPEGSNCCGFNQRGSFQKEFKEYIQHFKYDSSLYNVDGDI